MLKQMLISNWNWMRFIRLVAGLLIAIQAFQFRDALAGLVAAIFLTQALTNTSCCGSGSCASNLPIKKNKVLKKLNLRK